MGSHAFLDEELRIVLIGKTGAGKSETGNTIVGAKKHFLSKSGGKSVTKRCSRFMVDRFNRKVMVIDTPGLFDSDAKLSNEDTMAEIVRCLELSAPGPHAIILVTSVGRFTPEEAETVQIFKKAFGDGMMKYLLVLFTRGDDLEHEETTLDDYVGSLPVKLKQLLNECGRHYIAFNNRAPDEKKKDMVLNLFKLIDDKVRNNGGHCYTSEMYKTAERKMREKEEEQRRKLRDEQKREVEELEKKFRKEIERASEGYKQQIRELEESLQRAGAELGETAELKKEISEMKKKQKDDQERRNREKEEMERITEQRYMLTSAKIRELARDNVENEEPGMLGQLWDGLYNVGWGAAKIVASPLQWFK